MNKEKRWKVDCPLESLKRCDENACYYIVYFRYIQMINVEQTSVYMLKKTMNGCVIEMNE